MHVVYIYNHIYRDRREKHTKNITNNESLVLSPTIKICANIPARIIPHGVCCCSAPSQC